MSRWHSQALTKCLQASSTTRQRQRQQQHHASYCHATRRSYNSATTTTVEETPSKPATTAATPPPLRVPAGLGHRPDPFKLLSSDLSSLRSSILTLLRSGHPALSEIVEYYFLHPSKQIRPLLVLLLAQATNGLGSQWDRKLWESNHEGGGGRREELDVPLTRPDVLNDWNPNFPQNTREFQRVFDIQDMPDKSHSTHSSSTSSTIPFTTTTDILKRLHTPPTVLPTQTRLAQIIEMIHTASLLHDDVIDGSPLRRGMPSAPSAFGKKLSVLGGNFILGRASAALSRLGDMEVTELIASILSKLVDGEILQLKKMKVGGEEANNKEEEEEEKGKKGKNRRPRDDAWNVYIQKTYLKTASLMAKSARAAVVLGGCKEGDIVREIAYAYGRNLGIAFQLVDDVLDYESASSTLGKPGGADLDLGLATGPALYAWEEHPEMGELIQRKFEKEGDVEKARDYIRRSSGVQRTRVLAQQYANKAKEVIQSLPDSEAKVALEVLTERVVGRRS